MSHPHKDKTKLVVIMLDGCQHDYFKRDSKNHPGYRFIKENGVVADYVQPIFPSNSFQSWTTISTGISLNCTFQKIDGKLKSLYQNKLPNMS